MFRDKKQTKKVTNFLKIKFAKFDKTSTFHSYIVQYGHWFVI